MTALDREAILKADDRRREEVEVPEWGGSVFIGVLSGSERDVFETSILEANKSGRGYSNIRARLAALTICDDNGERLFSEDDVEALGQKSSKALDRVFEAAQRINGLTAKDVSELEGN